MAEKFDCVVVGSGPGGYTAAIRCAQRGASVAIVEKKFLGGTCLNYGCIPSKALLASAHTLLMAKQAAVMGIDIVSAAPDWPKIQARKDAIVTSFSKGLAGLIQNNKVKIIQGRAIITRANQIRIEMDSNTIEIKAGKIIMATGSQPIQIPTIPFDGQAVISSKEALKLEEIPQSMVIVGGGVIGCELACVYAAMGTKVTIVEAMPRLIPMEDQWVGGLLAREFKKLSIEVLTGEKVTSIDKSAVPAKIILESGKTINAEKILISIGRRAMCDKETVAALNLEMSGPAIAVDEKMQTSVPGIYAIGDCIGTTYLAHGAAAEAEIAAVNATGGDKKMTDYSLIPRTVYTFPEVASVGKNEESCKTEGLDISVGRSFFRANCRSAAHNETVGEIRVVRDNSTNKILGVTMAGAMVTELAATARTLIGTAEKITDISFPHPTVSEVLKEAVEDAFGLGL